jgi:hypothetical protein
MSWRCSGIKAIHLLLPLSCDNCALETLMVLAVGRNESSNYLHDCSGEELQNRKQIVGLMNKR